VSRRGVTKRAPHVQTILVVDDDPAITSVLKHGPSYAGFAVTTASSGTARLGGVGYVLREP